MRVLLVDDDTAYLTALRTVLAGEGHDVVACDDFSTMAAGGWHWTTSTR